MDHSQKLAVQAIQDAFSKFNPGRKFKLHQANDLLNEIKAIYQIAETGEVAQSSLPCEPHKEYTLEEVSKMERFTFPIIVNGFVITVDTMAEESIDMRTHFIDECGWSEEEFEKIEDYDWFTACVNARSVRNPSIEETAYLGACCAENKYTHIHEALGGYMYQLIDDAISSCRDSIKDEILKIEPQETNPLAYARKVIEGFKRAGGALFNLRPEGNDLCYKVFLGFQEKREGFAYLYFNIGFELVDGVYSHYLELFSDGEDCESNTIRVDACIDNLLDDHEIAYELNSISEKNWGFKAFDEFYDWVSPVSKNIECQLNNPTKHCSL